MRAEVEWPGAGDVLENPVTPLFRWNHNWAVVLALAGAIGAPLHGGYDLAKSSAS